MTAPRSRGVAPPAEAWDRAVAGILAMRNADSERLLAAHYEYWEYRVEPYVEGQWRTEMSLDDVGRRQAAAEWRKNAKGRWVLREVDVS